MGATSTEARALFTSIAPRYDLPAEILSFRQYARWRRALVRALPLTPATTVLDVATGTGLIARELSRRTPHVVGLDLTPAMLARASGTNVAGDARAPPFGDASFDVVTFSYLLRYVSDPASQVHELARVLKPGGFLGSVEFGIPEHVVWRIGWRAYALSVFPLASRTFGRGWRDVGAFLPHSIVEWDKAWPLDEQLRAWRDAGVEPTIVKRMTFGGAGIVIVGRKR